MYTSLILTLFVCTAGQQRLTSGMELKKNILVSGNVDSTVKVWDIRTGHCLYTLMGPNKHLSAVTSLQFTDNFVVTSSDDGSVKLWDLQTGDFIRNLVNLDSGGNGGYIGWRDSCHFSCITYSPTCTLNFYILRFR